MRRHDVTEPPSYGMKMPAHEPYSPPRQDPLTHAMLHGLGSELAPDVAVALADMMVGLYRSRSAQPQGFVRLLLRFRAAAVRHGIREADLPRLERVSLRPFAGD